MPHRLIANRKRNTTLPVQPDGMSDAAWQHWQAVQANPLYWETRMWFSALLPHSTPPREAIEWLEERGIERGTDEARNDYLHPLGALFIFRREEDAVEFALRWSGE